MGDESMRPETEDARANLGRWLWALIILVVLVGVLMRTSAPLVDDEPQIGPVAATQPSNESQPVPQTAPAETQAGSSPFEEMKVRIDSPTDQQLGWLRIVQQTRAGEPSEATVRYRPENTFDVETRNTDRFEIDLSALPVNRTKRFIMHIDGQDMLLFRKQVGVIRFERSEAGIWKAEKD